MQLSPQYAAALDAVREACTVTRAVQRELCAGDVLRKDDRSPVTVADFAAQAVIARRLASAMPGLALVGEESAEMLRDEAQAELRKALVERLRPVWTDVNESDALSAIDLGGQEPAARFWTLDPIDGTKGFLRNGQYAISLAYIDNGKVLFGVLGCPNLSADWERPFDDPDSHGLVIFAVDGQGCWSLPADSVGGTPERIRFTASAGARLRMCESAASGHSDRASAFRVYEALGGATSLQLDSQAKYAVVARGQADAYLRMPVSAADREYIWDHAPGAIIAEQAGVRVGDITGQPFDFTTGRQLARNRGILCASRDWHERLTAAISSVLAEQSRATDRQ